MKFNFKMYDKVTFHSDPKIDKKIKALLLWYDYEVIKKKLPYKKRIALLNSWISDFVGNELYEAVPTFKARRLALQDKLSKRRRSERPLKLIMVLYYRHFRKIIKSRI